MAGLQFGRVRWQQAVVLGAVLAGSAAAGRAQTVLNETFASNPVGGSAAVTAGDGSRYTYAPGALTANYDSSQSTALLVWSLGQTFTQNTGFSYSVTYQIGSGMLAPTDAGGQIAFGLINSTTTGTSRTSLPYNSFDAVTVDYFPALQSYAGTTYPPTLTATEIDSNAPGWNSFSDINFPYAPASALSAALPADTPITTTVQYNPVTRYLGETTSYTIAGSGTTIQSDGMALPGSAAFAVDSFAIPLWNDGYLDPSYADYLAYGWYDPAMTASVAFSSIAVSATGPVRGTWTAGASGLWNAPANWDPIAGVPGTGASSNLPDAATFQDNAGAASAITVTIPSTGVTISALTFSATASSYTIAGTGPLTLANPAGVAVSVTGTHAILAPVVLANNTTITTTSGSDSLAIGGNISDNGTGSSLTVTGAGLVTLSGVNSYSGGTNLGGGTVNVNADAALGAAAGPVTFTGNATLQAAGNVNLNAARTVSINPGVTATFDTQSNTVTVAGTLGGLGALAKTGGGTLYLSNSTYSGGTTVSAGTLATNHVSGSLTLTGSSGVTLTSTGLVETISALSMPLTATLNLGTDAMIITGASSATESTVESLIANAYASGAWSGTGITSSLVQSNKTHLAIGYAMASDLFPSGGTWNGVSVSGNELLIMPTLIGDANLDGTVNAADLNAMYPNFGASLTNGWDKGDVTYIGTVNAASFNGTYPNFGVSISSFSAGALVMGGAISGGSVTSAAPEPASLVLLGLGGLLVMSSRRRRHQA